MNTKRLLVITLAAALFVLAVIIVSIIVADVRNNEHNVLLPPDDALSSDDNDLIEDNRQTERVTVDTDTVQNTIRTIDRLPEYKRVLSVTNYWDGGSAEVIINAVVTDNASKFTISRNNEIQNIVLFNDTAYVWYGGDTTYYSYSVEDDEALSRLADEYQMLVTYEDVLNVRKKDIKLAQVDDSRGEQCIYVEYVSGELEYVTKVWVSCSTGLVSKAEIFDGTEMIYAMYSGPVDGILDEDKIFLLPDGTDISVLE